LIFFFGLFQGWWDIYTDIRRVRSSPLSQEQRDTVRDDLRSRILSWVSFVITGSTTSAIDVLDIANCVQPPHLVDNSFITPYIHTLIWHVPDMIHSHGDIWSFSCQSLERMNQRHGQLYKNHNSRRLDSMSKEIFTNVFRLHLLVVNTPPSPFNCVRTCGKQYIYELCFSKHKLKCPDYLCSQPIVVNE